MSELITLARPYAKAAFEFAKEAAAVDQWSTDLTVAGGLAQEEQILTFFNQPNVEAADLVQLVCGEAAGESYQNFIRLLIENDRLSLLPEVAKLFQYFKEQDSQSQSVDVYSAVELTAEQQQGLINALTQRTGKQITLTTYLDPSLIGGARIHCGDLVIDGSLRGKVDRLKTELGAG